MMRVTLAESMEVLEYEGNASERTVGQCAGGFGPGLLEPFVDHCVDLRVQRLDPIDGSVDEFEWRRLTGAHQFGLRGRVEFSERIVVRHPAQVTGRVLSVTGPMEATLRPVRP
jgi:hypothetical protein